MYCLNGRCAEHIDHIPTWFEVKAFAAAVVDAFTAAAGSGTLFEHASKAASSLFEEIVTVPAAASRLPDAFDENKSLSKTVGVCVRERRSRTSRTTLEVVGAVAFGGVAATTAPAWNQNVHDK